MGDMDKPEHIKILEEWMKSYKPEELFDKTAAETGNCRIRAARASGA